MYWQPRSNSPTVTGLHRYQEPHVGSVGSRPRPHLPFRVLLQNARKKHVYISASFNNWVFGIRKHSLKIVIFRIWDLVWLVRKGFTTRCPGILKPFFPMSGLVLPLPPLSEVPLILYIVLEIFYYGCLSVLQFSEFIFNPSCDWPTNLLG